MRILSIDPSSNRIETSTTGIVLLDNAQLVDYWVVMFGAKNFLEWFKNIGSTLEYDVVVVEKYEARDNDYSRDNSVLETIAAIELCYPNLILQRNAGYQSDIPNELLKALNLWKFEKSHHNDVRAAARLGLFYAMRNDIEEVIQDIGRIATKEMAN
ncbi:hypothetical protein [Streptococcus anginosus]|uniref:hypothetical protein n=1 Tax=Streptococcus anginosus TaxID=1328 RepID=UPI001C8CF00D|nr:hypothetical protein [Streptococcus anginosus]MBX9101885.1 hypothetical protein [Streptococcus anginosus]MBX9181958.1 hypothetical protein [Paeniclostridium sordellii]